VRGDKRTPLKSDGKSTTRGHKRGVVGYSRKTALLEEAITQMNAGKYGRSSSALKELLALDPHNMEARRLFATLHLRLGSLIPARQAFDLLINEAFQRQDYWLAESLLREYLAAGPRCVPFLEKLGLIYQEKGDVLEAVAEYGKAIDILIEDPDPDNPHGASQLYKKVRDLAPASPVAFRLAAFFDAQTGELLVRQSAEVEPTGPLPASSTDSEVFPEPVSGVMPWDVEAPPNTTVEVSAVPPTADLAVASLPSPNVDCTIEVEQPVEGHELPADSLPQVQIGKEVENVPTHTSESLLPHESASPVSVQETAAEAFTVGTGSEGPQSMVPLPEPMTEMSVGLQESDTVRAEDRSVMDHGSSEMAMYATDPQAGVPEVAEETPRLESDSHSDFISESSSSPLEKEQSTISQAQAEDIGFSPQPPVEAEAGAGPLEQSFDTSMVGVPRGGSTDSTAEPWKAPGFSWASVFDRAWNFGGQHSVSASAPEAMHAKVEEPVTSISVSPDHQQTESESVEIPERGIPIQSGQEEPSDLKPMPWDQIQESAIPIPPAQVDERANEIVLTGASEPETVQTTAEQPATPTSAAPTIEQSESVEIPERVMPVQSGEETASELKPMPWDQIQESAIPIPAPEVRESTDGIMSTVVEQSVDQAESAATLEKSLIPSHPAELPAEQSDTESILVDQSVTEPVSPKPDLDAAGVFQASPPERASISIEQEVQFSAPVASSIEEPPNLDESEGEATQLSGTTVLDSVDVVASRDAESARPDPQSAQVDEPLTPIPLGLVDSESGETPSGLVESDADSSKLMVREAVSPARTSLVEEEHTRITLPSEPLMATVASAPPVEEQQACDRPDELSEGEQAGHIDTAVVENPVLSVVGRHTPSAHEPDPRQAEWVRASEAIRFIEELHPSTVQEASVEVVESEPFSEPVSPPTETVDAMAWAPVGGTTTETKRRVTETASKTRSKLYAIRFAITAFVSSCFSTTRSIVVTLVGLVVLSGVFAAMAIGTVGLIWMIMEESPSSAFQNLTTSPQRVLSDFKKNGYLLLVGFEASSQYDPIQAGYEQKSDDGDAASTMACLESSQDASVGRSTASANVARGWFRGADPVGQFKVNQDMVQGWVSQHASALARYTRWHTLPFEDWGYGQMAQLPCASILFAHHVHLAAGFVQGMDVGVDRLETDLEAWRIVVGQAKTLPVKVMALQAINDDIAVASGLLVRSDFDGKYLARLTKILRPFDQSELSIRWPMQNELVIAGKTFESQLKAEKTRDQTFTAMVASALPLPKQRRLNDYAEYYDASYKAAAEGRYSALPKWKDYVHFPASAMTDHLTNPIENIVGLKPLASWEYYSGLVVDTEAHLRLASLQAWLRRGPADGDLMTRLAKAGQGLYDPYTGLPMLVNMKKGVLYSVGHDGKDQDADSQSDIVVAIPMGQVPANSGKPSAASTKSK